VGGGQQFLELRVVRVAGDDHPARFFELKIHRLIDGRDLIVIDCAVAA